MIARDNDKTSEAGHWYSRTGEPMYQVPSKKDGSLRNTTLADARKLDLIPSVSTIINCASAPALEAWKLREMLMSALTLPRLEDESLDDLAVRIQHDSKETGRKARDRGTDIHGAIETYFNHGMPNDYLNHAMEAEKALGIYFGEQNWICEKSFAHANGFGGKCDMYSNEGIVVDIKTKEFTDADKVQAYDSHLMQLSAYCHGLGFPEGRAANAFVSVQEPVQVVIIEWDKEDLERGWRMFSNLLQFWQEKNKHK
jgi:hypothetical protein